MNSVRPQTLDEILQDLEHHFSPSNSQKNKKKSVQQKFSQNQIIAGLTFVLVIVGATVGVILGQQSQDIRQQAAPAYPKCTNQGGPCGGEKFDGDACFDSEGFEGICDNDFASDGICTCNWVDVCCKKPGDGGYIKTTGPSCKHQIFGSIADDSFCEAPKKCSASAPTASACYGNEIGARCTDFNGTCVFTSTNDAGESLCACIADAQSSTTPGQPTRPPIDITANPSQPPQNTEPPTEPTQILVLPTTQIIPTNTLAPSSTIVLINTVVPSATPSRTYTPRPTHTSVPTTPGQPTNTPVPLPTETFTLSPSATSAIIALNTLPSSTPTPIISSLAPTGIPFSVTPVPTNTSLGTGGGSASTTTKTNTTQQPALPSAGNASSNTQIILTVLTVVLIIGAIGLLLFL